MQKYNKIIKMLMTHGGGDDLCGLALAKTLFLRISRILHESLLQLLLDLLDCLQDRGRSWGLLNWSP